MTAGESADAVSKIAIVTGGSRGLGRNTVLHLAKRGVDSLFTYRANRAEAEKLVGLVAEEGQRAIALPLDTGKVTTFDSFAGRRAFRLSRQQRRHFAPRAVRQDNRGRTGRALQRPFQGRVFSDAETPAPYQ
jgi:NAD(P)-dependent dehydrogenase (short-subunit alcohol dehydrogenase family)